MQLTKNFTLAELTASATAKAYKLDNTPNAEQIENLRAIAENILQPLRDWYERPVLIGSGFRSKRLNTLVGGVKNSQHMTGEAVDLCISGSKARGWAWFDFIRNNLAFDQLIWEKNKKGTYWVHVSFKRDPKMNRHQVITYLLKK